MHLLIITLVTTSCSPSPTIDSAPQTESRLQAVPCWFDDPLGLAPHRCFYLYVDEEYGAQDSRQIAFPVMMFQSQVKEESKNPVLHLGAGGPGASLHLDSINSVAGLYENLRQLSVDQGRDLFLMDPRGTGRSRPLLTCAEFTDNVVSRWRKNLTLEETYAEGHQDIRNCIQRYQEQGIRFSTYNSRSIVADVEQLRAALGIRKWVLLGASYGSIYAQLFATTHINSVEAMVLDSATFIDIDHHEALVRETMAPYRRLFENCHTDVACVKANKDIEKRFWALTKTLDTQPLRVMVPHPNGKDEFQMQLSGWRFIDVVLWGSYNEEIFDDLPNLLTELENGVSNRIRPYIESLLDFLTDETFSDITSSSHYCTEKRPHIDNTKMADRIRLIPHPYARKIALMGLEFGDHCDEMAISSTSGLAADTTVTAIPTLFIHGNLDSVTLIEHVLARKKNFANSRVLIARQAHSVLDDDCIRAATAKFLLEGFSNSFKPDCLGDPAN